MNDGVKAEMQAGGSKAMAMREKTWPERDNDGKLEALRQQLNHIAHIAYDAIERLNKLENHIHGPTGVLHVPMLGNRNYPSDYRRNSTPMGLRDKE